MNQQFKKIDISTQEKIYGGWTWLLSLIPMLLQGIVTTISSIKMIQTDNGSLEYNGVEAEWSNNEEPSSPTKVKEYFYAF